MVDHLCDNEVNFKTIRLESIITNISGIFVFLRMFSCVFVVVLFLSAVRIIGKQTFEREGKYNNLPEAAAVSVFVDFLVCIW